MGNSNQGTVYSGSGDPNLRISAPGGSSYLDVDNGNVWTRPSTSPPGSTEWELKDDSGTGAQPLINFAGRKILFVMPGAASATDNRGNTSKYSSVTPWETQEAAIAATVEGDIVVVITDGLIYFPLNETISSPNPEIQIGNDVHLGKTFSGGDGGMWIGNLVTQSYIDFLEAGASINILFTNGSSFGSVSVASGVGMEVSAGETDAREPLNLQFSQLLLNSVNFTPLTATETVDFSSMLTNTEDTKTITVNGASTANTPVVQLGWTSGLTTGIVVKQAWVSSANTVSITVRNVSAGTIDPGSQTVRATIFNN